MAEKIVLPRKDYLKRQVETALGPDNMWFTGEEVGHSPNEQEAVMHFAEYGGSKDFAEHFVPEDAIPKKEDKTT